MRKLIISGLLAVVAVGVAVASVTTDLTVRQVRDPVQLRAILNNNFDELNTLDATNGYTTAQADAAFAPIANGVAGTNAQARVATAEIALTNRYTKAEAGAAFATAAQGIAATNAQALAVLWQVQGTTLVYITGGVTNVIDADVTTP